MKLEDESDEILEVYTCTENDDVMLTSAAGQSIRFPVTDVRVFAGRNSVGVRGISLGKGDSVISMAILAHVEATPAERTAYLKLAAQERRQDDEEPIDVNGDGDSEDVTDVADLSGERYRELQENEEFILTVSEFGYGKRCSSYDFRTSGRGGKGIRATDVNKASEIGPLVAAYPVEAADQIMLVTDGGQVIRVPVEGIRFAGRATKGVTIFNTAKDEKVVSVERISDPQGEGVDEEDASEEPVESSPIPAANAESNEPPEE